MSYIIKYVIEKLGDPIENIVCGAAIMISITSLVFLFKLKKYIDNSKIVFVNGTCGKFEDERFMEGTSNLFKVLSEARCKVIVGGGDTASACKKFSSEDKYYFISSGGGATLEYIADGTLKALEWME